MFAGLFACRSRTREIGMRMSAGNRTRRFAVNFRESRGENMPGSAFAPRSRHERRRFERGQAVGPDEEGGSSEVWPG